MNRFPSLRIILLVVVAGISATVCAAEEAQNLLIDRIIAVVGEDVVMLSELRKEATKVEQRLQQKGVTPMPGIAAIQKQAFDTLVMNKIQLAEAERLGIEADEETITRAINAIAANNQMTVPELRDALQAEGLDFDTFRRSMRDEIIVRRLRNREVTDRIQVTKSEIDSYLDRSGSADGRTAVHLLYILIPIPDGASPEQREEARLKATEVAERLRKGEDFRSLAQQVSEGQNALQGGDLGGSMSTACPPCSSPMWPR